MSTIKNVYQVVKGEDNDGGVLYSTITKAAKAVGDIVGELCKGVIRNPGERDELARLVRRKAMEALLDDDEYMWEDSRCGEREPDPTKSFDDLWVIAKAKEVL